MKPEFAKEVVAKRKIECQFHGRRKGSSERQIKASIKIANGLRVKL